MISGLGRVRNLKIREVEQIPFWENVAPMSVLEVGFLARLLGFSRVQEMLAGKNVQLGADFLAEARSVAEEYDLYEDLAQSGDVASVEKAIAEEYVSADKVVSSLRKKLLSFSQFPTQVVSLRHKAVLTPREQATLGIRPLASDRSALVAAFLLSLRNIESPVRRRNLIEEITSFPQPKFDLVVVSSV
jgi:hypothetical protein